MTHQRKATESRSYEEVLPQFTRSQGFADTLVRRLAHVGVLSHGAKVVEIGCAQGALAVCLSKRGFNVIGIEPWAEARQVALRLAKHEECVLDIRNGTAESIPLADKSCDLVVASNVIEHVLDVEAAFGEVFRILKPSGVFWFSAASSVCPRQKEIDGFPLFPWYPNAFKLRIMDWAKRKKPHLVGHTKTPAINWFTALKARRMLRRAGFARVYDRWDLRLLSEGGWAYRVALRVIRLCYFTRLCADFVCEGCAYAALKPANVERPSCSLHADHEPRS